MAKREMAPADGDRLDLGGKLPQFKAFAYFVYRHLSTGDLAWVRIADVHADKLDDIQFATASEIHAYQMKWSNQEHPPAFTYLNFKDLLIEMVKGWKSLKTLHANEGKSLFVHMITNRKASVNDDVLGRNSDKLGHFQDFLGSLYQPLKSGRPISLKWICVLAKLRLETGLRKDEFLAFLSALVINIGFEIPAIAGTKPEDKKKQQDQHDLTRLIIEEVADKQKKIHYTLEDLVKSLNWEHRFKTTFQHEFFVDKHRYQPISSTISNLNKMLLNNSSGYLFLSGSPGSGKSTLLTQWAKGISDFVVRYYAFSNISISQNFSERGEAEKFYFDLVVQLNELAVVSRQTVLPHHDETFLRSVFFDQLRELNDNYLKTGKKTIIIVDGLDHIPREYQTIRSLLGSLPSPATLPEGIFIVLGSQSFEIDGLQPDVKNTYRGGQRNIGINSLDRKGVLSYIDQYQPKIELNQDDKEKIFEVSKGHPLQLTYMLEELSAHPENVEFILATDYHYNNIDDYYQKIWDNIIDEDELQDMLSLMARIRGEINPQFVSEWGYPEKVKTGFRKKAFHLFSKSTHSWVFFHNSFRQFIIRKTSIDSLTGEPSDIRNRHFHTKLSDFYASSTSEPEWNRLYHLYQCKQYDLFLQQATGAAFLSQILAYRPIEKVRQDMKLGLLIAGELRDHVILVRYLFLLSELYTRERNFDPINFVEEHLSLGNVDAAIKYMRDDHILNSSKRYALSVSQDMYDAGLKDEAIKLYNLGEPDELHDNGIVVQSDHHYDNTNATLEEWASAAAIFETTENIIRVLSNVALAGDRNRMAGNDTSDKLKTRLFYYAAQAKLSHGKWEDFDKLLIQLDRSKDYERYLLILLLRSAIRTARYQSNNLLAEIYYKQLTCFEPRECSDRERVVIAMTILKRTQNHKEIEHWINGIPQPKLSEFDFSDRRDLNNYYQRFELNILLNIIGKGISPLTAVPSSVRSDDQTLVEFERMLCLMAEIYADGLMKKSPGNLVNRIKPFFDLYYTKRSRRDTDVYKINQLRQAYFKLMIETCSLFGNQAMNSVKEFFMLQFEEREEYWTPEQRINVLFELIAYGVPKSDLINEIQKLEKDLLEGTDMAGRVERAQQQAKNWLKVKEPISSEQWMHRTIEEALSIGYRKDYQLNNWLEWLNKVNKIEPAHGEERIEFYLARLQYVKDVTELRPFYLATKKLLSVSYEWNFGAGANAQKFLLKNGLVHYEDSLNEMILGFLNICPAEDLPIVNALFGEVLLDLAEEEHSKTFRSLIERMWASKDVVDFQQELGLAVTRINTNALFVSRNSYHGEIVRFSEQTGFDIKIFDIPEDTKAAKESFEYDNHLTLSDHSTLKEEEVLHRVKDFDSLKLLFYQEDPINSSFSWKRVFEKVQKELTENNVRILATELGTRRKDAATYFELSKFAFSSGDHQLATELANSAIERSSSSGWDEFHDGGSRINAFKALQQTEGAKAVDKAFVAFLSDVLATEYPTTYAESLDDILPVITPQIDLSRVYAEIDNHVRNLLANATPDPRAVGVLTPSDRDFKEDLFALLHYLSRYPATPVKNRVQSFLGNHLNYFPWNSISHLADGDDSDQELLIDLLQLNQDDWETIEALAVPIGKLCQSKNFIVRETARSLSELINPYLRINEKPISTSLSPTYTLEIHQLAQLKPQNTVDEDGNIIDTDDVTTLTSFVRLQSKAISKIFGFPEINLHHRLYTIMRELADPYEWSSANEIKLRDELESTGNKMSMIRPRVSLVLQAMARMVTELDDAGYKLPDNYVRHFFFRDVSVWFFTPEKRPKFIKKLKSERFSVGKEWVHEVKKHPRINDLPVQTEDEWTVIGEYYIIKEMEWDFPEERYQAQLRSKDAIDGFHRDIIFGSVLERYIQDYLYLDEYPDSGYLVINNEQYWPAGRMPSKWIAFNPKIAFKLGWEPSEEEPFAWENDKGEMMARSIYWRDGNVDLAQRVSDCETGEGWYLIVSKPALLQVTEHFPDLIFEKRIERHHDKANLKQSDRMINVIPFKVQGN